MVVYKIENKFTHEVYIGATKRTLNERWKEHIKYSKKYPERKLYKAINKYGSDSFNVELIAKVDSFEELYRIETENIDKYNSVNNGYNTQSVSPQREDWEEFYDSFRKIMHSDKVRAKISKSMQLKVANGDFFTSTHRKKLSERAKGNVNGIDNLSHSVSCYCVDKGIRRDFKNYKEAGIWWYNTYHPFGEKYSQATYQRKIIDCIEHGYCRVKRPGESEIVITKNDIEWYRKEVMPNEKVG